MQLKRAEALIDEHLARMLGPAARREMLEFLSRPVRLEGAGLHVKTTLAPWLKIFSEASAAGWQPNGTDGFDADDGRRLATTLAKLDLGQKWKPLVQAVKLIALSGPFRVVEAEMTGSEAAGTIASQKRRV